MDAATLRWLNGYERWATARLMAAAEGLDGEAWAGGRTVGTRALGPILVHVLGAHQRWRAFWEGRSDEPRPEAGDLPAARSLARLLAQEFEATDLFLERLAPDDFDRIPDPAESPGVPLWQMIVHVANHGMQHRSEAAVILTDLGRSPGDLDLIDYATEAAAGGGGR
jgi:uncharacterized damage-inducible protein DinB